jgi:hypothetical protein
MPYGNAARLFTTANNAFERTLSQGGPLLVSAQRWWPAAQLGR